jgi:hypothetical protein
MGLNPPARYIKFSALSLFKESCWVHVCDEPLVDTNFYRASDRLLETGN